MSENAIRFTTRTRTRTLTKSAAEYFADAERHDERARTARLRALEMDRAAETTIDDVARGTLRDTAHAATLEWCNASHKARKASERGHAARALETADAGRDMIPERARMA